MSKPTPFAKHRRGPLKLLWYRITQLFLWVFGKVWFRLRTSGADNVPADGPVILISNHQSHLDPAMIGGFTRRPLSMMARDSLFTGLFGALIRSYDAIPVDRDGGGIAGLREILRRLRDNAAVLVFPEGTRSVDGRIQPLKPGFLALVRRGNAALLPMGIEGANDAMPRGASFPRPRRIAIVYGEPIAQETLAGMSDDALLELAARQMADCHYKASFMLGGGSPSNIF